MRIPGQRQVGADGVIVVAMVDRANDSVFVRQLGEARQMLCDRDARYAGGDRLELAPNLLGRVRLQVPDVQVRRAAVIEDEDARPRLAERARLPAATSLAGG